MKKPEWIFVGALVLIGVYFVFRYYTREQQFDSWLLVPKNTILVYETSRPAKVWDQIQKSPVWEGLLKIDFVEAANDMLFRTDSLLGGNGELNKFLSNKKILVSIHLTSSKNLGSIFYIPLSSIDRNQVTKGFRALSKLHNSSEGLRTYQEMTIHEIRATDFTIGYLFHKNTLIISTTGFLLEDVIRNIKETYGNNFLSHNRELKKDPSLKSDQGNLFVNALQWDEFMGTFIGPENENSTKYSKSAFFDVSLSANDLLFSGYMYPESGSSMISTFRDQEPVSSPIMDLVPNTAMSYFEIASSDFNEWFERWRQVYKIDSDQRQALMAKNIMNKTVQAIGLVSVASFGNKRPEKMLFIKVNDKAGILNELNKMAEYVSSMKKDTVYYEYYSNYKISLIEESELPAKLFGEYFSGFTTTYYLLYKDYVVLASTADTLKKWLSDLNEEETWGKTVHFTTFRESNLSDANLTYLVNIDRSWNQISNSLNPQWKKNWSTNSSAINQFDFIALQISNLDNRYYINANISYNPRSIEIGTQSLEDELIIQFDNAIIAKPKLVQNHLNGTWEFLIQDSLSNIILVEKNGDILWSDSIQGPVVSDIFQIDFYNNKKLQYLFATEHSIYLIDRNGAAVENYPIKQVNTAITGLYLVDYDNSKNYRILITDDLGNVIMMNKTGNVLEGWDPLALSSKLSKDVFHIRVRGRDRIVISEKNGLVNIFNRRGEMSDGFPLELGYNFTSSLYFRQGPDFSAVRFSSLSASGLLQQFDLNGKLYAKDQLYQPSGTVNFELIKEHNSNDYAIVRHDLNRLAILDNGGNALFEKDYVENSQRSVQYYYLGSNKKLFIVRDMETGATFLYDEHGTLINTEQFLSQYPLSIVYHESIHRASIYLSHGHTFEVKSFSF